jgi:hypothetical protein
MFVQLYRSQMRAMRHLAVEEPAAHAVLYVLLERMDMHNAIVVSYRTLGAITKKSESTIKRSIKVLRERNYIEVLRVGTTSVIVVNRRVAWTASTTGRKLAIFDARVIVSEDEQEDFKALENAPELHRLPPFLRPPENGVMLEDSSDHSEPELQLE